MDGPCPARVPDGVITEIRSRERDGLIELPKPRASPGVPRPMRDKALRPNNRKPESVKEWFDLWKNPNPR